MFAHAGIPHAPQRGHHTVGEAAGGRAGAAFQFVGPTSTCASIGQIPPDKARPAAESHTRATPAARPHRSGCPDSLEARPNIDGCPTSQDARLGRMPDFTGCASSPDAHLRRMRIFAGCQLRRMAPGAQVRRMRIFPGCATSPVGRHYQVLRVISGYPAKLAKMRIWRNWASGDVVSPATTTSGEVRPLATLGTRRSWASGEVRRPAKSAILRTRASQKLAAVVEPQQYVVVDDDDDVRRVISLACARPSALTPITLDLSIIEPVLFYQRPLVGQVCARPARGHTSLAGRCVPAPSVLATACWAGVFSEPERGHVNMLGYFGLKSYIVSVCVYKRRYGRVGRLFSAGSMLISVGVAWFPSQSVFG